MCLDEMQNMYNGDGKNTYGFAVAHAIRTVPTMRVIGLTGTIMSSSAAEIIDALNIVEPTFTRRRSDFFETRTDRTGVSVTSCKRGLEVELAKELAKTVIYFTRAIDSDFPTVEFAGELYGPEFRWLKLVKCEMSEFQERAYRDKINTIGLAVGQSASDDAEETEIVEQTRVEYMASNMIIPSRDGADPVYKIRDIVAMAGSEVESDEFAFVKKGVPIVRGPMLVYPRLLEFSATFGRFMGEVIEQCKAGRGEKVLAFHQMISIGGTSQIEQILRENGFIPIGTQPHDHAICVKCGTTKKAHADTSFGHAFVPAKFATITGSVDPNTRDVIINTFNSPRNVHGTELFLVLLSKVAAASITFKCVRHIYVLDIIVSLPALRQLIGRGVRKHSHMLLPEDKRNVTVHVMAAASPVDQNGSEHFERYRIHEIADIEISYVTHFAKMYSIACAINHNSSYQEYLAKKYSGCVSAHEGRELEPGETLCPPECDYMACDFTCAASEPGGSLEESSYRQKYIEEEIQFITMSIKHMFVSVSPVWAIETLFEVVRENKLGAIPWNASYIERENFDAALYSMMDSSSRDTVTIKAIGSLENAQGQLCTIRQIENGCVLMAPIARTRTTIFNLFDTLALEESARPVKIDNIVNNIMSSKEILTGVLENLETICKTPRVEFSAIISYLDRVSWQIQNVETAETRMAIYVLELIFRMCISTIIHSQLPGAGSTPGSEVNVKDKSLSKYKLSPRAIVLILGALDHAGCLIRLGELPETLRERTGDRLRAIYQADPAAPALKFIEYRKDRAIALMTSDSSVFRKSERFSGINVPVGYVFGTRMCIASPSATRIAKMSAQFDSKIWKSPAMTKSSPALSAAYVGNVVSFDFDEWSEVRSEQIEKPRQEGAVLGIYSRSQSFQPKMWSAVFKLRIAAEDMASTDDKRYVHKGIVCYTMGSERISEMFTRLGVDPGVVRGKQRSCQEIELALLARAETELKSDTKLRWIYTIFENDPIIH
jgi:hypothetical protein